MQKASLQFVIGGFPAISTRRDFEKIVGEIWGKRYGSVANVQATEVKRYLREEATGKVVWWSSDGQTRPFAAEDQNIFIHELLRHTELLGLALTPEEVEYLILDSLKLPEGSETGEEENLRLLADAIISAMESSSSISLTAWVTPALPVLELYAFFHVLLALDFPDSAELVVQLLDPDVADELLRTQYLNQPDVFELDKTVNNKPGRRIKVPDQPLIGTGGSTLVRSFARNSKPLFEARMVQVFLMAAYGIHKESKSLIQLLKSPFDGKTRAIHQALEFYRAQHLAESLMSNIQKRFYAEQDYENLGKMTQVLVDEIQALSTPIIPESQLQTRLTEACITSALIYFKGFRTQLSRERGLRIDNPIVSALKERHNQILEIVQSYWISPYIALYREVRKAIAQIEASLEDVQAPSEASLTAQEFFDERQEALDSLDTVNKRYSALASQLLRHRGIDQKNPEKHLAALFACEAYCEHKDTSSQVEEWTGIDELLDYFIDLVESVLQVAELRTGRDS
ncbi:MAG: hypothetical protein ACXAB4_09065 [Candidatus Hodarchaeales archaeon]